MRILVTGGRGFIGTRLVNHLSEITEDVFIIDKVDGQLVQDTDLGQFGELDFIFHLAATPRLGISLVDPAGSIENNITSLTKVLEYCRKNPTTKLIFISSSSAKFANLARNPYALSKAMGEQLVDLYRDTYKVHACSVRLFNVYGPGEAFAYSYTTLVKQCKIGLTTCRGFFIEGDGSIIRDYTHVDDVCEGLVQVMDHMALRPGWNLYELGSGEASVTVKEIVEEFQRDTSLDIEYRAARPGDPPYTCANQFLRPSGWEPKIKVLDYIREWKANGYPSDR
jgi:nucleoside-diphosphate-sugar epimerase